MNALNTQHYVETRDRNSHLIDDVLSRLGDVDQVITSELEAYRSATLGDDVTPRQDCLVSIIIPVFNERNTIARVISRVAALPLSKQIVVVDDHSDDGTREILERLGDLPQIDIIFHDVNQGKGAALRTGLEQAIGKILVIQDADLEYDPREIPGLVSPIMRGEAEIVYGSRFLSDQHQDKSWIHRFGNAVLTQASNFFSGLKLTDMETCYKAFHREVLKCLELDQNRFGIEPELTAKLARRGYRFAEVPISYRPRSYAEGKKIGIRDLFKAFYCIGRYGIAD